MNSFQVTLTPSIQQRRKCITHKLHKN